jgi:MFS family permease
MISTGTLGENKANVKPDFRFVLLSPFPSALQREVIYRRSMDDSPKRSASVTAAAVVAILGSLFLLLCCSVAFFAFLSLKLTGTSPEAPPFVRTAMLATQGLMMCVSLFGIATGIGVIYLRNWARISMLTWAGLSVFFGVIGIPIAYFALSSPIPNAPALPAESMQAVRWILLFIYGLPLLIGIWWLILFNRKSVKAQFAGTAMLVDPSLSQKPRCPVPIAVIAWLYIGSIFNLFLLPFFPFRLPVFIFGLVLPKSLGLAVLILSALAFAAAGVGLLKLKTWSYSLTIGLQVFWLTSWIVSMLSPNYSAVMDSFFKKMQASLHLPETQFSPPDFAHHHGWAMVLGLLFAGAILGLLVYYRPRFLEAASAAASSS